MFKQIYGLKDGARAWRKTLHQAFAKWMSCRQLHSEPELYCVFKGKDDQQAPKNTIVGANEHDSEP